MALLVLGSVAFDDVRTPAGYRERVLGGSATYFAWAASTLVQTDLIAAVGRDFPDEFSALLRGRGIGLDGLVKMQDADTFHWSGRYGEDLNVAQTNWVKLNVLGKWKPQVPTISCQCSGDCGTSCQVFSCYFNSSDSTS